MRNSDPKPLRAFQILVVCALMAGLVGLRLAVSTAAPPNAAAVRMIVDYGDGVQVHFTSLPWREGMTVVDALNAAKSHPHGITYKHFGTGSNTLISQIGDLKNQGGGDKSKNWLFYVNEKTSDVGAGSAQLKAGDAVLWKFEVFSYNP